MKGEDKNPSQPTSTSDSSVFCASNQSSRAKLCENLEGLILCGVSSQGHFERVDMPSWAIFLLDAERFAHVRNEVRELLESTRSSGSVYPSSSRFTPKEGWTESREAKSSLRLGGTSC